jgi:predicted RNA binding protein YcfA (HicA-like mRNA interferase family)
MVHPTKTNTLIVPDHGSAEVGKGLENAILKQAGLK